MWLDTPRYAVSCVHSHPSDDVGLDGADSIVLACAVTWKALSSTGTMVTYLAVNLQLLDARHDAQSVERRTMLQEEDGRGQLIAASQPNFTLLVIFYRCPRSSE